MRFAAAALMCAVLAGGQSRVDRLDFEDLNGSSHSYTPGAGVAVVAFISANCPVSNAFNDRLSALYREYSTHGVGFVVLNANANESAAEIAAHAGQASFPFPVYRDVRNRIADQLGAMATPETFVLDRAGAIRYHGYIEDSVNEARVKSHALRDALDALLAGKPVPVPETKAFGCTIKRVKRSYSK